jgi:hypothetical protein
VSLAPDDGKIRTFSTGRTVGHFIGVRGDNTVFKVYTSMHTYSSHDLRSLSQNPLAPGTHAGATFKKSPYLNFIASDVANNPRVPMEAIIAGQVHELGNSLAYITGNSPSARSANLRRYDSDAGNALTECVYGGFVLLNGRITRNPGGY